MDKLALGDCACDKRPGNIVLLRKLNQRSLGALIVFYEYRIFAQDVILQIYSCGHWDVKLGKELAAVLQQQMENGDSHSRYVFTAGLIDYCQRITAGSAAPDVAG